MGDLDKIILKGMLDADEMRQCGLSASASGRSWGCIWTRCHISKGGGTSGMAARLSDPQEPCSVLPLLRHDAKQKLF